MARTFDEDLGGPERAGNDGGGLSSDVESRRSETGVNLNLWLSQDEVCRELNCKPRTLNENIKKHDDGLGGWNIERRERKVEVAEGQRGRKPETCYNPDDVFRIRDARAPRPTVFQSESGVGPREDKALLPATPSGGSSGDLMAALERFGDRFTVAAEAGHFRPAPASTTLELLDAFVVRLADVLAARRDRGPWLTMKVAAAESGLRKSSVIKISRQLLAAASPDVIMDGELKIRRAALFEVDAGAARAFLEEYRAARKAATDDPADEAADLATRPITPLNASAARGLQ